MLTNLITTIACFAISVILLDAFFALFSWYPLPTYYLSLSTQGLMHGYLWQPFTHLFLFGTGPVTIFSLIWFAILLYVLWILGNQLIHDVGERSFLLFFLVIGMISGVLTVLLTQSVLAGCSASVFAVFVAWALFYPEQELLFFFLIPIKAKWLLTGILGASLLVSISQLQGAFFVQTALTTVLAYFWSVYFWGATNPFGFGKRLENFIKSFAAKGPKVVDLTTKKAYQSDDEFIDRMLDKISRKGENSLTWSEKRRMQKISEKKASK